MRNPFTLSFGKKPLQYISRISQTENIIDTFCDETPSSQVFLISGVRGSGKTVLLTDVYEQINKMDNWVAIELNPNKDLLQSLAAQLYTHPEMHTLFVKSKIDLSVLGIGLSIEEAIPVSDHETAITKMLSLLKKRKKRLLITIDEVVNNNDVRVFVSSFQIFIRHDLPVFLLMTVLYDNIYNLQNEKTLTFLYRAPKIILEPLNLTMIRKHYMDLFRIDFETAEKMTSLTKGYPFAFQVLGYLYWEKSKDKTLDDILPEYDHYLDEFVYNKIWSEMSDLDRKVAAGIPCDGEIKISDLRTALKMNSSKLSLYRDRLNRKGIVNTTKFGYLSLILPRFGEFIREQTH